MKKTYVCAQHGIVPANEVSSKMIGRREARGLKHFHDFTSYHVGTQLRTDKCEERAEVLEAMTAGRKVVVTLGLIKATRSASVRAPHVSLNHAGLSAEQILGSLTLGDLTN